MQQLAEMISADNVLCRDTAASRKRLLQNAARTMATQINEDGVSEDVIFDQLMARERLGSTGLGDGIAIPHCRMPCANIHVALITLATAIDYEASDGKNVDLFFVLVVPLEEQNAHLLALATLAEIFSDANNCKLLRSCTSVATLQASMQDLLRAIEKSKIA